MADRTRAQRRPTAALLLLLLCLGMAGLAGPASAQPPPAPVTAYLFWSRTCPHCAQALRFLGELHAGQPGRFALATLEIDESAPNRELFSRLSAELGIDPPAVPLIVIGEEASVGYGGDASTGAALVARIERCAVDRCADPLASRLAQAGAEVRMAAGAAPAHGAEPPEGALRRALPSTVELPLLGTVDLRQLSLPVLTVTLAAVDGFNPCAMWVLVFLIGLLLGVREPGRMWLLGSAFLLASALVYYLIMAAWLEALLLVRAVGIVRVAVGVAALGAGLHYLWSFARNPEPVCHVTAPERRRRILDRLKALALEPRLGLAMGGIVLLAGAVNLVEFLCSAGIPAVYTGILAESGVPAWQHQLYLLLYLAVFMLDDAAVFVTAMLTLRATGLTGRYMHYGQLVGGLVLVVVGALLLLRPELLTLA